MKIYFGVFLSLMLCASQAISEGSCTLIPEVLKAAEQIRGLKKKTVVPCFLRTKDEVKKYLTGEIKRQLPPERLSVEEFVAKTLGIVPKDFDYQDEIVNLYISQLGGYYDPRKHEYVMAAWLPGAMQPMVAVHELTHALQDQYYGLKDFMDDAKYNSDQILARSALVEGDATAVMNDFQRSLMGLEPISKEQSVESILMQTVLGSFASESLQKAPSAIRNSLIFPYASGLRFAHVFLKRGGYKSLDSIFNNPPKSTEEILHPEKYGKKDEFIEFTEADLRSMKRDLPPGKVIHQDRLGEFFVSVWLTSLGVTNAPQEASGWGGDRVFVIENGGQRSLIWIIRWDTPEKAKEFEERVKAPLSKMNLKITLQNQITFVEFVN